MKVNLDHNEFVDFICIMLYDLLNDHSYLTKNERFNKFIEYIDKKGIRSYLFKYFLSTSSHIRRSYRQRFKDILQDESKKPGTIFVYPTFDDLVEDIQKFGKEEKEILLEKLKED